MPPGTPATTARPGSLGVAGILLAATLCEVGELRVGGSAYKHLCVQLKQLE